jgi:23S rRNA (pseudouridine1915-N3)-methyltransferase
MMQLHIIARGKIGRSEEAGLMHRYLNRISWPVKLTELADRPDVQPKPCDVSPCRLVMLDEKGRNLASTQLANIIGDWRDDGVRETRFLIGGADGFDDMQRKEADLLISFGKATWPHLLARAMLAEQLWRATSILAGHPYHREG